MSIVNRRLFDLASVLYAEPIFTSFFLHYGFLCLIQYLEGACNSLIFNYTHLFMYVSRDAWQGQKG